MPPEAVVGATKFRSSRCKRCVLVDLEVFDNNEPMTVEAGCMLHDAGARFCTTEPYHCEVTETL